MWIVSNVDKNYQTNEMLLFSTRRYDGYWLCVLELSRWWKILKSSSANRHWYKTLNAMQLHIVFSILSSRDQFWQNIFVGHDSLSRLATIETTYLQVCFKWQLKTWHAFQWFVTSNSKNIIVLQEPMDNRLRWGLQVLYSVASSSGYILGRLTIVQHRPKTFSKMHIQ